MPVNKPLLIAGAGLLGLALWLKSRKSKAASGSAPAKRRKIRVRRKTHSRRRKSRSAKRMLVMLPSGRISRMRANPFAKGKSRPYAGRKHRGTVFKSKGRKRMIVRAGKRRISRPWSVR